MGSTEGTSNEEEQEEEDCLCGPQLKQQVAVLHLEILSSEGFNTAQRRYLIEDLVIVDPEDNCKRQCGARCNSGSISFIQDLTPTPRKILTLPASIAPLRLTVQTTRTPTWMNPRLGENQLKKKRLAGACDLCKRRKVRYIDGDTNRRQRRGSTGAKMYNLYCCESRLHAQCFKGRSAESLDTQIYAVIQEPEASSTHRRKSARDHVADILSTSTVYIPSNDVNVSHEILVAVANYARELEEKVAELQTELHTLSRGSGSRAPSVMSISGQFHRGADSTAPNVSMDMGRPLHGQPHHPIHREIGFDGMEYRPETRSGDAPYRSRLQPQYIYPTFQQGHNSQDRIIFHTRWANSAKSNTRIRRGRRASEVQIFHGMHKGFTKFEGIMSRPAEVFEARRQRIHAVRAGEREEKGVIGVMPAIVCFEMGEGRCMAEGDLEIIRGHIRTVELYSCDVRGSQLESRERGCGLRQISRQIYWQLETRRMNAGISTILSLLFEISGGCSLRVKSVRKEAMK
ncbi:hypothetical protein DFH08DRAFT_818359 [Mycena albidolilacea]|uniref:Uncharacterized protein n=1 Tax=Mycena albidolilacea TaxID=1033008 RepID=A0AAD6ZH21_9AGAR|nr:hypothetical protein DFH08DRAFT_818359 [Mycena albidolilacea]